MKRNRLDIYKIAGIIIVLCYISDVFQLKIFYNLAELFVVYLSLKSFSVKKTPAWMWMIFLLIIVNVFLFALFSPYFHYYSVVTNLRSWMFPILLFYVGIHYSRINDDEKMTRFLLNILLVSLPLSILGLVVYFRSLNIFNLGFAGDPVGGIYGSQGGSGQIGLMLAVIVVYLYVKKIVLKTEQKYFFFYITLAIFITIWAESKIGLYAIIIVMLNYIFLQFRRSEYSLKSFIVLGSIVFLFMLSYSYFYKNTQYEFFNLEIISGYLSIDNAGSGQLTEARIGEDDTDLELATRLSRLGGFFFSFYLISENPVSLVFGYGPGSAQYSLQYRSVIDQFGFALLHLDFFSAQSIIFEYGLLGIFIWCGVLIHLYKLLFTYLRKNAQKGPKMILFLFFYLIVMILTFAYNWAFFRINFGGLFFLFLGAKWDEIYPNI